MGESGPAAFFAGLFTLISTALLVLALIGFYKLNERYDNPVANIQVAGSAAQIARGEQLAHACASCHTPAINPLSGVDFAAKFGLPPLGHALCPQPHPSGNIKIGPMARSCAHPRGHSQEWPLATHYAGRYFRNLCDDDVQAIVAYLRSQPATGGPTPANNFNLLGAVFMNLSDFRTAQQTGGQRHGAPTGNLGLWQVHGGCNWMPDLPRRPIARRRNRPARPARRPQSHKDCAAVDRRAIHDFLQHRPTARRKDSADPATLPSGFSEPGGCPGPWFGRPLPTMT